MRVFGLIVMFGLLVSVLQCGVGSSVVNGGSATDETPVDDGSPSDPATPGTTALVFETNLYTQIANQVSYSESTEYINVQIVQPLLMATVDDASGLQSEDFHFGMFDLIKAGGL